MGVGRIGWMASAAIVAGLLGCAEKDEKRVQGRTVSSSTAPGTSLVVALRRTLLVEQATGVGIARAELLLHTPRIADGALAAHLRLPDGGEVELVAGGGLSIADGGAGPDEGGLAWSATGLEELLLEGVARAGGYTVVVDLAPGPEGDRHPTATLVAGPLPALPHIVTPVDLSRAPAGDLAVGWSSGAARHDVVVRDAATGAELYAARDLLNVRSHVVPGGALAAAGERGARLRIEVLGVDAVATARVRTASGASVLVDVAGPSGQRAP